MHDEFVEPTKRFADIIIPNDKNNGLNETAVSMVLSRLHRILDGNDPLTSF
jgi:uridine kinase